MDKIGKYKILGELGRGAMGIVYKGEDPLIGRILAIKTIRMEAFHKPHEQAEATQRFIREAQSAGNLSHPNIVTIYDVGQSEGMTYIAMEYIEGQSLDMLIAIRKEFSLDDIINLISQIGTALDYAHQKGIVHRDIKPGNILIDNSGKANIVDFGIARISSSTLTQTGTSLGTPNYMSPEQVAGRKVDHRADIFALGAILYELLTFEKPFSGDSFTTIIYKIMNEDPPPLRTFNARMPEDLDIIIRKALAKKAEDRYQSCRNLIDDLSNYQTLGTTLMAESPLSAGEDKSKKKETERVQVEEKKREKEKEQEATYVDRDEKKPRQRKPLLYGLATLAGIAAVVAVVYFVFLKNGRQIDSNFLAATPPSETEEQAQPPAPDETSNIRSEIANLLNAGTKAFDNGDYDLTILNMEKILELDPQQSRAEDLLAEAKKRRAEQQEGQNLQAYIQQARTAFQSKNYTEAIQQSERALAMDTNNSEARDLLLQSHLQLGIRFFENGEYPQSIDSMAEVLKLDPENRTAQDYSERAKNNQAEQFGTLDIASALLLAEQASSNKNYQECILQTEKVLLLDERNQRARQLWFLAHAQLGQQAFDSKDYRESIQHMESILSIDPQNKDALASRSKSRAQIRTRQVEDLLNQTQKAFEDKDYEKSLELSQNILNLEPDNTRAKEYSDQSSLQLAPKQINAVIGEYIQSVKNNTLVQFYANRCAPDFYQTIKAQTETVMKSFSALNISLSDVSIQFMEIFHAQVSFSHILTGTSLSDGVTNVLSDGNMEWEMKNLDGGWKITKMQYTPRR